MMFQLSQKERSAQRKKEKEYLNRERAGNRQFPALSVQTKYTSEEKGQSCGGVRGGSGAALRWLPLVRGAVNGDG